MISTAFRQDKRVLPRLAAALLATTGLVSAMPALAQAAQTAAVAATDDDTGLADIVVTATKRSESLQRISISVQALGTQQLEQQQVANFDDYAKLLPSVSYQSFGPGQSQLYFRGISSGGDGLHGGSLPATGLYLDESPLTTIAGSVDLHVYDIARVEALSGPQGTLFGASSLSGTLRIITNKPDPSKLVGGYDLQLNKFGKGDFGGSAEGFVNVPLSDHTAIRLVGFYQRDGGYIDNLPSTRTFILGDTDPTTNLTVNNSALVGKDVNDVETYGARVALGIELDDNWSVTPSVIYQHQLAKGTFIYDPAVGDLAVSDYLPTINKDRWFQAALTIEGKIGNFDIVYAGNYFERKVDNEADYSYYTVAYDAIQGGYYTNFPTATGGFLNPTQRQVLFDKYTKMAHEIRLTSPSTDRLRITAGAFYQRQTDTIKADYIINGLGSIPNSPRVPTSVDDLFLTRALRIDRDYAVFGEASYDITNELTLTGGIRGFLARNTNGGFSGFLSNAQAAICLPTTLTDRPCNNYDRKIRESGETHRVNLTYKPDGDKLFYATWSTGYRPGGTNRRPNILPFKADTLTNYEIGWKTSWLDRSLRFNGAVFLENWNNVQYGLSPVGSAGVTNVYNAGSARVKGIEADLSWRASKGLTISGSATYIDAKLTSDFCQFDAAGNSICTPGIAPAAAIGDRLPVQPHFKGNATARYEFPIGKNDAFVQGSLFYQDGTRAYLTRIEANLLGDTAGFATADFSTGITVGGISVEAFIQNAFDKRGQLSRATVCAPAICGGRPTAYPIKPQIFGIKVGQRF